MKPSQKPSAPAVKATINGLRITERQEQFLRLSGNVAGAAEMAKKAEQIRAALKEAHQ